MTEFAFESGKTIADAFASIKPPPMNKPPRPTLEEILKKGPTRHSPDTMSFDLLEASLGSYLSSEYYAKSLELAQVWENRGGVLTSDTLKAVADKQGGSRDWFLKDVFEQLVQYKADGVTVKFQEPMACRCREGSKAYSLYEDKHKQYTCDLDKLRKARDHSHGNTKNDTYVVEFGYVLKKRMANEDDLSIEFSNKLNM